MMTNGDMMDSAGSVQFGSLAGTAPTGSVRSGMMRSGTKTAAQLQADEIVDLLTRGKGAHVTDEMMTKADQPYLSSIYDLPMDEASRMARAKEMGFMTGMPLYHGTANDFQAFDPARAGSATRSRAAAQASVWAAPDPEVAAEFASISRQGGTGSGESMLPLLHRTDSPTSFHLGPDDLDHEVAATLRDAFDGGRDAVMLRDYRAVVPQGQDSTNIVAIKAPEQVRSRFELLPDAWTVFEDV